MINLPLGIVISILLKFYIIRDNNDSAFVQQEIDSCILIVRTNKIHVY